MSALWNSAATARDIRCPQYAAHTIDLLAQLSVCERRSVRREQSGRLRTIRQMSRHQLPQTGRRTILSR